MIERQSALDGHYETGRFGSADVTGITLRLMRDLELHQVSAWPQTIATVATQISDRIGGTPAPGAGKSVQSGNVAVLRIEPLKWWMIGTTVETLDAADGSLLDLSHSRTRIVVSGEASTDLLNRLLPLDLRDTAFPIGSVASSVAHHVGVTLWRSADGYELFIPRGFALSLWEILLESARQFGVEVI